MSPDKTHLCNWQEFIDAELVQEPQQFEDKQEFEAYLDELERRFMEEQYGFDWEPEPDTVPTA